MSKNNAPAQKADLIGIGYELQDYHIVLNDGKYEVEPFAVPGDMMKELVNRPMCYFKWSNGTYNLYVCLVVDEKMDLDQPNMKIEQTGSTYFLKLPLKKNELRTERRVLYIKFEDLPRPVGFKVPSLSVKVVPAVSTGVGNEEGSKSTTVDYEDADDEVIPAPEKRYNGR